MKRLDFPAGHRRPVGGGTGSRSVQHTVEPVIGPPQILGGRRCAQDWQVAIDLGAVGVDKRAASAFSEH